MFLIVDHYPNSKFEKKIAALTAFLKIFSKPEVKDSTIITQALTSGLREAGAKFLYNDFSSQDQAETLVVLDDVHCLRWAIEQKQKGLVKRLLVGPFITTLPSEARSLLFTAPFDGFIFLNRDARDQFVRMSPKLQRATYVWSQGIDKFIEMIQGEQPPTLPPSKSPPAANISV